MPGRSTAGASLASARRAQRQIVRERDRLARAFRRQQRQRNRRRHALFAAQARPERGVDHRFDVRRVGFGRQVRASLPACGRQMFGEVTLHSRGHGARGRIGGLCHGNKDTWVCVSARSPPRSATCAKHSATSSRSTASHLDVHPGECFGLLGPERRRQDDDDRDLRGPDRARLGRG